MKIVRDVIMPLIVALIVAAAFQVAVASFKVYGSSMLPNIHPGEYILVSKIAYFFHPPERGEIIVFHSPHNPNSDLIKRIVALPGDTVEVKNRKVFINGNPLVEPYTTQPPKYDFPRQEIGADRYFVLGDNRNNSSDSHKGWTVPRQNIIGKAWITYWPFDKWRTIKHYSPKVAKQAAELSKPILITKVLCPAR